MKKVLIVDDSIYTRSLLDDILKEQGFEILDASSADEMLNIVDEYAPDIVLIDIVMPGINGIDAVKILHERCPGIKIIICSALQVQQMKDQAIENGACGFIQKPFGVDIVMNEINKALQSE